MRRPRVRRSFPESRCLFHGGAPKSTTSLVVGEAELHGLPKQGNPPRREILPRECAFDRGSGSLAESPSAQRVTQRIERPRESGRIALFHDETGLSVGNDLRNPTVGAPDDRKARRHRFKDDDWHPLDVAVVGGHAWNDEDVGLPHLGGDLDVRAPAKERHAIGDAEFSREPYVRGTLGMARAQNPNSGDSQFFIMFAPMPSLNGQYTVWGRVLSGMQFVDRIERGEPPRVPDKIIRLRVAADVKE